MVLVKDFGVEVVVVGRDLWVENGEAASVEEADELARGYVSLVLYLCCGLGKRTVAPKAQMSIGVDQAMDNMISGLLNTGVPTSSPSLAYLLSLLIVEPKSASCTSVISCDSDATSTSMLVGLMSSAQSACCHGFDPTCEEAPTNQCEHILQRGVLATPRAHLSRQT